MIHPAGSAGPTYERRDRRAGAGPRRRPGRDLFDGDEWRRLSRMLAFSTRQRQLAQHLFDGLTLPQIASHLRLSLGTIKTYTQRLYRKLDVAGQRELILAIVAAHLDGDADR